MMIPQEKRWTVQAVHRTALTASACDDKLGLLLALFESKYRPSRSPRRARISVGFPSFSLARRPHARVTHVGRALARAQHHDLTLCVGPPRRWRPSPNHSSLRGCHSTVATGQELAFNRDLSVL